MFTGYLVGYAAFRALFGHSPAMVSSDAIFTPFKVVFTAQRHFKLSAVLRNATLDLKKKIICNLVGWVSLLFKCLHVQMHLCFCIHIYISPTIHLYFSRLMLMACFSNIPECCWRHSWIGFWNACRNFSFYNPNFQHFQP